MTPRLRTLALTLCAVLAMSPMVVAHRVAGAQSRASTITLAFLRHTDPVANNLEKKLIRQYEQAHPNIRINYITVPDVNVFTKFEAMSVAGSPPDIINFGSTDVPEVWQRGQLAPVDLGAAGVSSLAQLQSRYISHALSGYIFNGRLYALPHELSDYVMWVNTQMLAKAHIDQYPHTWEQVGTLGKKLMLRRAGKVVQEAIALPFNFP